MKKLSTYNWWLLLISIFLFALQGILSREALQSDFTEEYSRRVIRTLDRKKQDFENTWRNDTLIKHLQQGDFNEKVIEFLREKKIIAMVYERGQLRFWTSVAIDEAISNYRDSMGYGLAEIKRGYYFFENRHLGDQTILLCYPLYRKYQVSNNPLLDEGFNVDLAIASKADFSVKPRDGYIRLETKLINYPIYVYFHDLKGKASNPLTILTFFLALFCLVIVMFNIFDYLEARRGYFLAWLSLSAFLVLFRMVTFILDIPAFFKESLLFSSDVYSSWTFLPSLGDLMINALIVFIIAFSAFKGFLVYSRDSNRFTLKRYLLPVSRFLMLLGILWYTWITLTVLQTLVNDSKLNFDVSSMLQSGTFTILGLLIAAMLLTAHFLVVNIVSIIINRLHISTWELFRYFLAVVGILGLGLWLTGFFSYVLLVQSVSYLVALYMAYQLINNQNYFQRSLAIIFIVAVFASSLFYRTIHDREKSERRELAQQVFSPKDLNAETVFLEIETSLEYDNFIREYFRNPLLLKSQLEKRIKQLYFTGYLSRFDVDIFDYDTLGSSFKELNFYPYSYLENVYNTKTESTISNHFYFINDPGLRFGYIAKYEVCTPTNTLGKLFIVLKPKFVQDEKIFTELLSKPSSGVAPTEALENYSYAIYQNGLLSSQSGVFPYPLNYGFDNALDDHFVRSEGYSHYIIKRKGGISVIVSRKKDTLLEPVTIFSFLFLSFSVFASLVFAINLGLIYLRVLMARLGGRRRQLASFNSFISRLLPYRKFRGLYFSTRIQIATIGLVLVALLLTGYFTIQYISFKYEQRQNERLDRKVKSILSAIENERRFEQMMMYNDEVAAYLNQLAEFYNTDINLYDLQGNLKASTQMRIFQSGLLLNKMNPLAYAKISTETRSQHTQYERIGKLDYLASYIPVFDSRHQILAYLHIPFFSNEKELSQEMSSFLESFINIYVFFFILAGILAYFISQRITAPLTIIQNKLSQTRFGNKNAPLEWQQNDEIGLLVRQYNDMLRQLEESASALAQSEREGAWKEMAKQIAHEIKNPLTPMKLSVQHLQRAWLNKADNLDQTFQRVTGVLIEQIDSLSLLATEFSSFAKMPALRMEEFELTEVLNSIVELYFDSENIRISYQSAMEPLRIRADKDQLSRVFNNVIKNAIQAIPEDREGRIEVAVERNGNMAQIRITDNGTGISEEIARRIFSPSFSTKNSGMGLGLAISREIVENCGGTIEFTSEEGRGTCFVIRVPLKDPLG